MNNRGMRLLSESLGFNFSASSVRYNITVKPFFCSIASVSMCVTRRPTLVHHNLSPVSILLVDTNMQFEDVIFEGGTTLIPGCFSEDCMHCQYTTTDPATGVVRDQQGNVRVAGTFASLSDCARFSSCSFVYVAAGASLTLSNVTFQNFRQEYGSIFTTSLGSFFTLKNVNFSKMVVFQNRSDCGVLSQVESFYDSTPKQFQQYKNGYFFYSGGIVENLNFGIEYRQSTALVGFITSHFHGTVWIQNVTFRQNSMCVLKNSLDNSSKVQGSLLYLENTLHAIIENCLFELNYGLSGSILRINSDFIIWKSFININEAAPLISMNHFSIINCVFRNNSAVNSLISFNFAADLQNVEIKECEFKDSIILQGSLITFQKTQIPSNMERFGGFVTFNNSLGFRYHVQYPSNYISISNSSFHSLFYSISLISFANLTNIDIRNLSVTKSGDTVNENLFTTTFATLEQLGYISQTGFATIASLPCLSGLLFNQCFNTSLAHIEFENAACHIGSVALTVNNSEDVCNIQELTMRSNIDERQSLNWISIRNSKAVFLSNIYMANIKAFRSPIEIDSSAVIFTNSLFVNNRGNLGGAIFISALLNVSIQNCNFVHNQASEGGSIYVLPGGSAISFLSIDSSVFTENSAEGRGGVLEIAYQNTYQSVTMAISNVTLKRNSGDGVIHFQERLKLKCRIIGSTFIGNDGLQSAPLNIFFESGKVSIEDCYFENNAGQIASSIQIALYSNIDDNTRLLTISSVVFKNHKGKTVIYASIYKSDLITSNVTFIENSIPCIELTLTRWRDTNSNFLNNNATNSVIQIHKKSFVSLYRTLFLENMIELSGSCMSIDALSEVKCTECTFTGNTAQKYGGVAIIRQNSYVFFKSSVFLKNNANLDGAALYFLGTNAKSEIANCTFEENSSNGGLISLLSSYLTISNSTIRNNTSVLASPGITLNLSNLTLTYSEFENQKGNLGVFLALLGDSYANIRFCLFSSIEGKASGNAIAVLSSAMIIASSSFQNINIGNVIYIYNRSNVTIDDCSFVHISKGGKSIVFAYESTLEIQSSFFSAYNTSAIFGEKSEINIASSSFEYGTAGYGTALWCISCSYINISYSVFSFLCAEQGGAIFVASTEQSMINISHSKFTRNTAEDSAAIYAENVNLTLHNSDLSNGTAYSISTGRGGAVTLICSLKIDCRFVIALNAFRNNHAELKGGAVFWDASMPSFISNRFQDNSAIYGDDIASFPVQLIQIPDSNNIRNTHLENISSGQISGPMLQFALVDHNNIIVDSDYTSHASMIPTVALHGAVKGVSQAQAYRGVFSFSKYVISATPGSQVNISVVSSAIKSDANNTILISVSLRNCEIGEMEEHNECIVCPSGTYSFGSKESCKQCPAEALCYGNYSIVPRAGYWRSSNTSDIFLKCSNENSCLKGNPSNLSEASNCADGYENHLCQVCSKGYYYAARNSCSQCPSKLANYLRIGICLTVFIVVIFVMVNSSLNSAVRPASTFSIYLKIAMNYFQVVMLISSLEISWPETLKTIFIVHQSIGGASESFLSFDCLAKVSVSTGYYNKLISTSVLPIVAALILSVLWLIISCFKGTFVYMSNQFVASFIIVFFIFQPSIMKTSFSAFSCIEIDESYWLKEVMSEKCWSGTHLRYALIVALPSIIVWNITLPTVCLLVMIRVRFRLHEPQYKLLFGFLCKGFKPEEFYWEFMILGRKLLIVIISIFVRILSASMQALTIFVLLFLDMMFQDAHQPFATEELNRAEKLSTLVCAATLFIGLFYLLDSLIEPLRLALFIVVLLLNILLLIYLASGPLKLGILAMKIFALKHLSRKTNLQGMFINREHHSDLSSNELVAPEPSFSSNTMQQIAPTTSEPA